MRASQLNWRHSVWQSTQYSQSYHFLNSALMLPASVLGVNVGVLALLGVTAASCVLEEADPLSGSTIVLESRVALACRKRGCILDFLRFWCLVFRPGWGFSALFWPRFVPFLSCNGRVSFICEGKKSINGENILNGKITMIRDCTVQNNQRKP